MWSGSRSGPLVETSAVRAPQPSQTFMLKSPCLAFKPHLFCVQTENSWQDGRGGLQAHFLGLGRAGEKEPFLKNLNVGRTDKWRRSR